MANPLKGEVDMVVGETTYTLKLGVNGLCEAEALTGLKAHEIGAEIGLDMSLTLTRALLCAALHAHHPSITLTDAGEIIEQFGLAETGAVVGQALIAAWPKAEGAATPANPQKRGRKAGTG